MRQIELDLSNNSCDFPLDDTDCDVKSNFFTLNNEHEDNKSPNNKNKNKRKALVPQRASPIDHYAREGDESQTSQDSSYERLEKFNFEKEEDDNAYDDQIVKELCEETNGEQLDQKTLDDVKAEWKSKSDVKCNMCEKLFQYKSEFDSHYQSTYNATPVYTCSFCNKTMEKYSSFRSHCYRHITEGRYKCKDCPQSFGHQSLVQVHMLAKHSKVKPFSCDECGKSFVTKPGLKIHAKKHQAEVKEDYPCAECGKILHTRGGLTSHMNVHRLGRRFMCDVCGKTFTQKVNMQQHVKQHTGDKPYECDKCGKTFAERSHLARHYSFHSNARPHKCEVCGKMYKTERCLKVHSMVHGKERPYICTYCNKGFLSSTKLKQHFNIHTGERPYACKYCERKFTNYPNWLKHTRRRHNVDHKTGKDLPSKDGTQQPKQQTDQIKLEIKSEMQPEDSYETQQRLIDVDVLTPLPDLLPHLETVEPIHHDNLTTDFKLSKTDELFLQQNILNFPITEISNDLQHIDIVHADMSSSFSNDVHTVNGQILQSSSQFDLVPLQFIQ